MTREFDLDSIVKEDLTVEIEGVATETFNNNLDFGFTLGQVALAVYIIRIKSTDLPITANPAKVFEFVSFDTIKNRLLVRLIVNRKEAA